MADVQHTLSSPNSNALAATLSSYLNAFAEKRESLGLSNPGTVENVAKEVQRDVLTNNHMFTGLRADVSKTFSAAPMFNVAHSFSQGSPTMPPYSFITSYGTPRMYLMGNTDNEGSLAARANYRWTDSWVTKTQTQIQPGGGQAMMQIDQDIVGNDFSASLKSINPSILDGGITGIFVGSYLQAVTPALALGLEAMWSRGAMQMGPESTMSYVARYKSSDWVASAQFTGIGALQTSYWRRLTDKVEVGTDLTLQFQPGLGGQGGLIGGLQKQGAATLGAKYSFRTSIFRAQVDSAGKLSTVLEKMILPNVHVAFSGELDHAKQSAKVGVGVSVDIQNEEVMMQQERMMQSGVGITLPPM